MTTFIICDKENGVLVPLRSIIQQLSFLIAAKWCFRDIHVHTGQPFGLTIHEFERLTRQSPNGYFVSGLRAFIDRDIQIIDGEIIAMAEDGVRLLTIMCEDATQWEISTDSDELAAELDKKGFKRAE